MIWATEFHTMITFEQPNQQSYGSILCLSANSPLFGGVIGWYDWGRSAEESASRFNPLPTASEHGRRGKERGQHGEEMLS